MSDQEYEAFQKTLSLAQAALHAQTKRDEALRAETRPSDEDESLHHMRYK